MGNWVSKCLWPHPEIENEEPRPTQPIVSAARKPRLITTIRNLPNCSAEAQPHVWKDFCEVILIPLLRENFSSFESEAAFGEIIRHVWPQRPNGLTYTSAADYVDSIRPCLYREALQSVLSSVSDFLKNQPDELLLVRLDSRRKSPTANQYLNGIKDSLAHFYLEETIESRNDRINRNRVGSGLDNDDEENVPWTKELILITFNKISARTGLAESYELLGFANCFPRDNPHDMLRMEVWTTNETTPSPCNNSGLMIVQRLCQFSSIYRQSWALSCLLRNEDELANAFLYLSIHHYRYHTNQFGSESSSLLEDFGLNKTQKEAAQNLAWSVTQDDSVRILGLHGPPGTGKSKVVVALVQLLLATSPNMHILVAAPTNTAVDAVGLRIANRLEQLKKQKGQYSNTDEEPTLEIHRFGRRSKIDKEMRKYSYWQMLGDKLVPKKVFLTTLNGCGSGSVISVHQNYWNFDVIIIDEAGQALQPDTLIPAMVLGIKKIILIGDPNQLPATVTDKVAKGADYSVSWLERIGQHFARVPGVLPMLDLQYRMHPEICEFPSYEFYGGKLGTDSSVLKGHENWSMEPFRFFNVRNSKEEGKSSKFNSLEIQLTEKLLQACVTYEPGSQHYGVITGYAEQTRRMVAHITKQKNLEHVKVSTVDGFQGQENKVIIISTVRAGTNSIGFLNDRKRVNVALTRARKSLFILGCANTLMKHPLWKRLINQAKRNGNYVDLSAACWADQRIVELQVLKNVDNNYDIDDPEEKYQWAPVQDNRPRITQNYHQNYRGPKGGNKRRGRQRQGRGRGRYGETLGNSSAKH